MKNLDNTLQNLTNSGLEQVSYKKGDIIYKFNENPKFAYFIYTGSVNIVSKNGYNLGKVNEGELFGEISSLFNKEHSVSAEAASECRLLIIEKNLFYNKVQNSDPIIKAIIRTLTGRLNDMNEKTEKIWKELHFLSSIKQELED
jgi:CRP-like cAMP-binding protein